MKRTTRERRAVEREWWGAIFLIMFSVHLVSACLIWCAYTFHPNHDLYPWIEQAISWLLFFPGVLVVFVVLITTAMVVTHRVGAPDHPVFWFGILWWIPGWVFLRLSLFPLISTM